MVNSKRQPNQHLPLTLLNSCSSFQHIPPSISGIFLAEVHLFQSGLRLNNSPMPYIQLNLEHRFSSVSYFRATESIALQWTLKPDHKCSKGDKYLLIETRESMPVRIYPRGVKGATSPEEKVTRVGTFIPQLRTIILLTRTLPQPPPYTLIQSPLRIHSAPG